MSALLMSELIICEVLTALEQHEPVDLHGSARRCKQRIPGHAESEAQLLLRIKAVAMEYRAAILLGVD